MASEIIKAWAVNSLTVCRQAGAMAGFVVKVCAGSSTTTTVLR